MKTESNHLCGTVFLPGVWRSRWHVDAGCCGSSGTEQRHTGWCLAANWFRALSRNTHGPTYGHYWCDFLTPTQTKTRKWKNKFTYGGFWYVFVSRRICYKHDLGTWRLDEKTHLLRTETYFDFLIIPQCTGNNVHVAHIEAIHDLWQLNVEILENTVVH